MVGALAYVRLENIEARRRAARGRGFRDVRRKGIRSLAEPFLDTTSDFAEIVFAILGVAAKLEHRRIKERTVRGVSKLSVLWAYRSANCAAQNPARSARGECASSHRATQPATTDQHPALGAGSQGTAARDRRGVLLPEARMRIFDRSDRAGQDRHRDCLSDRFSSAPAGA
jgi:hypothetical protein